jgi:hypothetical protein
VFAFRAVNYGKIFLNENDPRWLAAANNVKTNRTPVSLHEEG